MTRAKATVDGYLWNHAGKVLEYLLLFVITVLIARGLGVEANGVYAALISFAQLLIVLSSLSLESALNRFVPHIEATLPQAAALRLRYMLRRVFLARGALLIAVASLAFLALQLPGLPTPGPVRQYFWLLIAFASVRSFVQLLTMVFVAQLRTRTLARIAVAVRTIELAGIAVMAATGLTVGNVMAFLVATGMIQVGASFYFSRTDFSGEVEPYTLRPLFAFGAIYWSNTILEYFLGRQGDVFFLTTLLPTPVPASMYNVAFSVVLVAAQGLTLGLGGVTLTSFSRLAATSVEKLDRFYGFLVRLVSLMVLPVLVFVFFNAGPIVTLLFSHDFIGAAVLIQGMVVFRIFARLFAGSENAEYLLARGRTFTTVQIGILGAAANILLDVLLVPRFAAFGAVIGSGCANLLVNMLGSWFVRKEAGRPVIQWGYWGLISISAAFAGIVTTIVLPGGGWVLLLLRGMSFGVITTLLLLAVKPFPSRDAAWVTEINGRLARLFLRFTRQPLDPMMLTP